MKKPMRPSRRQVLRLAGAAAAAVAAPGVLAQTPAAPAVRRKVKLSYWTWADNPGHQKRLVDAVNALLERQGRYAQMWTLQQIEAAPAL